jgi:peptidoglycan/LPS O-acetylase OafA/YrhL
VIGAVIILGVLAIIAYTRSSPPSDTDTDMQTATRAGMFAVGALWGFRDREELESHGARAVIEGPTELIGLLD